MSEDEVLKARAKRLREGRDVGPEEVESLLDTAFHNPILADFLLRDLRKLSNLEAIAELCRHAMRDTYPVARLLVMEEDYAPVNQYDQALFFYVTRQWEKYKRLDPDRQILRKAYQNASKEVRQMVAQTGRRSGRTDIVAIVTDIGRTSRLPKNLSEQQQEVSELAGQRDWATLWQKVFTCQPVISSWILQLLSASGWQPEDKDQQADFNALLAQARACREDVLDQMLQTETSIVQNFSTGPNSFFTAKLSPDGQTLALIRESGLELFNIRNGLSSGIISGITFDSFQQNRNGQLAFSADSRYFACCAVKEDSYSPEYGVTLVDVAERKVAFRISNLYAGLPALSSLRRDEAPVIAFAGTDLLLILAKNRDDSSHTLKVYSLPERRFLGTLDGIPRYSSYVHEDLATSLNGELLVEYNSAGELYLWSVINRELLSRLPKPRGLRSNNNHLLAFSPDGRTLAYVMRVNQVRLIDVVTGEENSYFAQVAQDKVPTSLCFSRDGQILAVGYDNCTISLWRVSDATLLKQLKIESGGWIADMVFTPKGHQLICLTNFGLVRNWNLNLLSICQNSAALTPFEDWRWLKETSLLAKYPPSEQAWLVFLETLFGWRWRYASEIEEALNAPAEEFDIELEIS